jgi:hypothetical protein
MLVMKFRVFSCGNCGHQNPLGAELCENCDQQTPLMNWRGMHIVAFYLLVIGGAASVLWG